MQLSLAVEWLVLSLVLVTVGWPGWMWRVMLRVLASLVVAQRLACSPVVWFGRVPLWVVALTDRLQGVMSAQQPHVVPHPPCAVSAVLVLVSKAQSLMSLMQKALLQQHWARNQCCGRCP